MHNNRRLKPNLLDPMLEKKIVKTLNPVKADYWAPTKNGLKSIYMNYIKPNIYFVIFIGIIIIFLIYRYISIRNNREKDKYESFDGTMIYDENINTDGNIRKSIDEYTDAIMTIYNQQKENMRDTVVIENNHGSTNSNMAYPIYPYGKGGLIASNKR